MMLFVYSLVGIAAFTGGLTPWIVNGVSWYAVALTVIGAIALVAYIIQLFRESR